jgi:aminopeptidase-like protein
MNSGLKNNKFNVKKVQRKNRFIPKNLILCEPHMSKRGLYPTLSTKKGNQYSKKSINFLNFLQYADGKNDLADISNFIKLSFKQTSKIFKILLKKKLISAS